MISTTSSLALPVWVRSVAIYIEHTVNRFAHFWWIFFTIWYVADVCRIFHFFSHVHFKAAHPKGKTKNTTHTTLYIKFPPLILERRDLIPWLIISSNSPLKGLNPTFPKLGDDFTNKEPCCVYANILFIICLFVGWFVYRWNRAQGTTIKNAKCKFICEILERPLCCALRRAGREHARHEDVEGSERLSDQDHVLGRPCWRTGLAPHAAALPSAAPAPDGTD